MMSLKWVKSSYSGGTGGNCVEVAALPDGSRAIRDSKDRNGPVLFLTPAQWAKLRKSLLPGDDSFDRGKFTRSPLQSLQRRQPRRAPGMPGARA
jgi:hypothetical protein